MHTLFSDLRFALRQLRKTPGMAALAILTLALGVGANMAIFTVIENVLLRPLPYANSDRLVLIGPPTARPGFESTSWLNFKDIHSQAKLFQDMQAYSEDLGVMQTPEGSKSVVAPHLTPGLFPMLDAHPILGRTFSEDEGRAGGPDVVLLSEDLWRGSFHADRNIIGRPVKIAGTPHTVIGVMPATFHFPESMGSDKESAVWLPLQPTEEMLSERGYHFIYVLGIMRPETSPAQIRDELTAIASRIPQTPGRTAIAFRAQLYQEVLTGPMKPVLYGLLGALGLVLLIACANVSNLLIARCLVRRQEYAVRLAIGAGRSRLIRQMLTEGLVLSLIGCGLGLALDYGAITAIRKLPDGTMPLSDSVGMQWSIILILAAVAILTTLLSSLLPALLAARSNPQDALQASSRGVGARSVNARLSGFLVSGEVALSVLLLVGTGLLFHTIWNLERSRLGFETARITSFTAMPGSTAGFTAISKSKQPGAAPRSAASIVYGPALDRIRATPGVESAALATAPPFSGMNLNATPHIVGEPGHLRRPAFPQSAETMRARCTPRLFEAA